MRSTQLVELTRVPEGGPFGGLELDRTGGAPTLVTNRPKGALHLRPQATVSTKGTADLRHGPIQLSSLKVAALFISQTVGIW